MKSTITKKSASVLILLTSILLWAGPGLCASRRNCSPKQLTSIDLVGADDILVPFTIQNTPVFMVLNTGSAFSVFFSPTIDQLGLTQRPLKNDIPVSMGGAKLTDVAEFKSLKLGDVRFGPGEFAIYRYEQKVPSYQGIPIVGALGLNIFTNMDFELDLAHKRIALFSQDHCTGKEVYWTNKYTSARLYKGRLGNVYFPMELDGKKIEATIDTSRTTSSLHTDITKRLFGFDEKSLGTESEKRTPGSPETYFYRAMKMTALGVATTNTKIVLLPPEQNCSFTFGARDRAAGYQYCAGLYPLQLGRNALEKLRVYFATKEGVVYYSNADATH